MMVNTCVNNDKLINIVDKHVRRILFMRMFERFAQLLLDLRSFFGLKALQKYKSLHQKYDA